MYEINRNASVEYTPRARTSEFLRATARGDTELRLYVFLGASVHGYIFITIMRLKQLEIHEWSRKKARDLEFEGQRTTLWYQHSPYTSMVLGINK